MIRLIDGTEWPNKDYHAKMAFQFGCTRSEAKHWLLMHNYSRGQMTTKQFVKAIKED
jgi:hypothetical protein